MILDDIIDKRRIQLHYEKEKISFEEIVLLSKQARKPKSLYNSLKNENLNIISEVKKSSPSKGIIKEDFDPVFIAKEYEKAGAKAISVLTEEFYFNGSSEYLKDIRKNVDLPILRKDFIFDPYQIYEARVLGADAILLIVSVLQKDTLIEFMSIARDLSLDCLVEVHNKEELSIAIACKAKIIGINNRNLKTFDVSLDITKNLISYIPKECVIVSESGIKNNADMKLLKGYGANAVLIGETLMRSDNIQNELKSLMTDL